MRIKIATDEIDGISKDKTKPITMIQGCGQSRSSLDIDCETK